MSTSTKNLVSQYLAAWRAKDANGIAACVHQAVHLKGPMAELTGRDAFVESAKRMFPMLREHVVRGLLADAEQAMFVYDFVCAEPIGVCRTAERVKVEAGLITDVELFFDPRPFEQALRATGAGSGASRS